MRRLQDLPIKQKVTLVILPTCSATLLLACEALAAYEVIDFRRALVRDMTVLADVLAKRRRRQPFSPADSSVRCLSGPARRFGEPQTKTAGRTGPRILTKTPLSRATRGGAGRQDAGQVPLRGHIFATASPWRLLSASCGPCPARKASENPVLWYVVLNSCHFGENGETGTLRRKGSPLSARFQSRALHRTGTAKNAPHEPIIGSTGTGKRLRKTHRTGTSGRISE
jgi:hypothetical protein